MHLQCIAGIVNLNEGWWRIHLVESAVEMSRSETGRDIWGSLDLANAVSISSANHPHHGGIGEHNEDRHMTDDRH